MQRCVAVCENKGFAKAVAIFADAGRARSSSPAAQGTAEPRAALLAEETGTTCAIRPVGEQETGQFAIRVFHLD